MLIGLKPGTIRYPGGAIGNYTDWRTGQYMQVDARDPEKGQYWVYIKILIADRLD